MRIFFFNRYLPPDHSATSQLLGDLARHLAEGGSQVVLVGSRQRYDDATAMLPRNERIDGFDVVRVGGTRFGRDSLAGRALDYASYFLGAARVLWFQVGRGDTVVLMTDPPMLGALLGPLARWRGARCVNWLQDLFPEVAQALLGRSVRLLGAPLRWLRDQGVRTAACNVVICEGMAGRLVARGVDRKRLAIIENWTDDNAIQPMPAQDNPLRRQWGLQEKFVVGHSGNLGRAHDWRTMLDAATALRGRADIHFVMIGGGNGLEAFAAEAAQRGLENVSLHPYQSRDALVHSLSVPDLHWLSLHPALEGCILPSKLYGIRAAGRAALFIGATDGEVATRLRDTATGFAVAPGDASGARAGIERLADDRAQAHAMGARARADLKPRTAALALWRGLLDSPWPRQPLP
ncbi:glycosyltransferase family 4 protein [Thermomonas carbonis]|uniref:Glycosyltransferase family 4 protein n=1 Tax=Thermomonas carbonis TaxID=1463158 RepID=A0A7G9SN56_9GAMM|nr:glycosyltransferase family 4 protein [Thermomonas carbonis]QNN69281.1 glycosyltransferase family 4 protein [Thermomonas carbonis]GHC05519.1 glycosyltransferase WbuB [Thermomonas carbonis]